MVALLSQSRGTTLPALTRRATLGLLPALLLPGCGRGDALRFWAISYEGDYAPLLMPAFTRATGIVVEVQSLPWTAAHEKLLTAFVGGSLPDVMMLPDNWVDEFAMIGAIAPVQAPSEVVPGLTGADGRPDAARASSDRAVPWSMAPLAQFFRRDLVEQAGYESPPTDWSGWRAMGQAIKRRRPDDFAFLLLLNWWDVLFCFLSQTGDPPLRERDTRGNFRSAGMRAALGFYNSLFADGLAPRVLSTEIDDPVAAFAQGLFAVYPSGPTLLPDLYRRRSEIAIDRWATARMPGPNGPAAAASAGASLAISAATRRPDDAHALLAHLSSAASELELQSLIGSLPANAAAWSAPALRTAVLKPFADQMRAPAPSPSIVEWERIRLEVQLIAERVVRGALTVETGLAEMDRRTDQLLARRRALVQAGKLA